MYPKSDLDSGEDIPREIEANTEAHPFLLPVLCNDVSFLPAQVNSGCDSFAALREKLVQRLSLERIALPRPR